MKNVFIILFGVIVLQITAQDESQKLNSILDKIDLQSQKQEKLQNHLTNYKYNQFIHFVKMDDDGEIEEQSKHEFTIYVKSDSVRKRELISALNYEDGKWIDVTLDEKESKKEKHSESKSFSLSEMVGPENRDNYNFEIIENTVIDSMQTVHLRVESIEEDEDRFQGDLWFETINYSLVRANLQPSEMPTFVDDMKMFFKMQQIDSLWFPQKIKFDAEVGILFLFSGKIHSEILFSDFEFNQQFDEIWFRNLEDSN